MGLVCAKLMVVVTWASVVCNMGPTSGVCDGLHDRNGWMGMGDFVIWDWSAPSQELLDVPRHKM
jgi:hypothetical protein